MSEKKFKIKPKVWPKEYTFEEFKQLNPNIAENLLVNYYNKYLQEYAENRSRHITHFNNTKDNLTKELHLLNEKITDSTTDDGDQNVGWTGGGRKYRSPIPHDTTAVHFDGIDDFLTTTGFPDPSNGTYKPFGQITLYVWWRIDEAILTDFSSPAQTITNVGTNGGWHLFHQNKRIKFSLKINGGDIDKEDTGIGVNAKSFTVSSGFNALAAGRADDISGEGKGWHNTVVTYDGRYLKLYNNGKEANSAGTYSNPSYTHTGHTIDVGEVTASLAYASSSLNPTNPGSLVKSGSMGGIFYQDENNRAKDNLTIGIKGVTVPTGGTPEGMTTSQPMSGSIAELAIWDRALDAETIKELYHNVLTGSAKLDLTYPGWNNGENNHDHPYDLNDEGHSYKNVGKYVETLVAWYRFEQPQVIETNNTSSFVNSKNQYTFRLDGLNAVNTSASFSPGI